MPVRFCTFIRFARTAVLIASTLAKLFNPPTVPNKVLSYSKGILAFLQTAVPGVYASSQGRAKQTERYTRKVAIPFPRSRTPLASDRDIGGEKRVHCTCAPCGLQIIFPTAKSSPNRLRHPKIDVSTFLLLGFVFLPSTTQA
ncbi:BZ3500_MvSof-1268-A1-R1_Chr4-3g07320 [Microbotryum saponariae]|uniref:BZ3500_MvSof-1268-A1-R1_Chr4-3g07320 protein n=1 Tax=Microbotryum saponariae TaxID=289078 RepID=A0A2X0M4M7_9BASI|nr:BZ3500_MvSof-1268-A1-R1_Chr4-3g07320 [Microbotryum saponariae]SDA06983.1 BZ3501_MvSof-1269-A2-R1_Chr4-2g07029 [Microbotryum saponariae]